jgi:hypothetical protein
MTVIEKAGPVKNRVQCKREHRPAAEDNATHNIQFGEPGDHINRLSSQPVQYE